MQKLRQKQKRLKKIMKGFVIATAVLLFIYIGVQPTLAELSTSAALLAFNYFCDILVIVSLALVLVYYSKYWRFWIDAAKKCFLMYLQKLNGFQ